MDQDETEITFDDLVKSVDEPLVGNRESWWVCRYKLRPAGYFIIQTAEKPTVSLLEELYGEHFRDFEVLYGPVTQADAEDYLNDVDPLS